MGPRTGAPHIPLLTWRMYARCSIANHVVTIPTTCSTRVSCTKVGFTLLAMARTRGDSDGAGSKRLPALFTESYCTSVSDITKSVNSRRSNTGSSTTVVAVVAPRWPFPTAEEPGGHAAVLPCARSMCHGAACRSGAPCGTCMRSHIARAAPGTTARPWSTRTFSTVFAAVQNHGRVDAFGQILTC